MHCRMLSVVPLSNRPEIRFRFQAFTLYQCSSCNLLAPRRFLQMHMFLDLQVCFLYCLILDLVIFGCWLQSLVSSMNKKEALENLNLILIVLCINELVLRVNSSYCNLLLYWLDGCYLPLHKFHFFEFVTVLWWKLCFFVMFCEQRSHIDA
jgi:hypothetical protein